MMYLGHQRAHGIYDYVYVPSCLFDHMWRRTMCREYERGTWGYLIHIVDKYHAQGLESFDHVLVVNYLMVAVHGRFEYPDHPGQSFNGFLHTGAEAAWRCEYDTIYIHYSPYYSGSLIRAVRPTAGTLVSRQPSA